MQVKVSGRHMGVSDAVKQYCTEKAGRLNRFYDRINAVEVVIEGQSGIHKVELIAHVDGTHSFVAKESRDDVYAAFDVVIEKLERQLRDHKEKLRNRKHAAPPEGGG